MYRESITKINLLVNKFIYKIIKLEILNFYLRFENFLS